MTLKQFVKPAGAIAIFAAIVLAGMLSSSPRTRAITDDNESNESKIQRGFEIAPVPLNLDGKNRELVGLGSYIVNAQGDCNGCHSAGPATEFAQQALRLNSLPEEIHTLASRKRSIQRPTWVGAGTSARSRRQILRKN